MKVLQIEFPGLFSSYGHYDPAWGSGVKAKPLWGRGREP